MLRILLVIVLFINAISYCMNSQQILFYEDFENTDFAEKGWYDQLKGNLSSSEHIEGSTFSLECKFQAGARTPEGGTPGRHLFDETDEVCLSYYVKYSSNFVGSGKPYHPHEFHFITNKDSKWVGPAFTHLTTYIEHNAGKPLLGIQDGENIDQSRVGENLIGITEERGVAGCNGSSDGYPDDCYLSGNEYVNGKQWKTEFKYFSDELGSYYKNNWHYIEAYFKLNSIINGVGVNDGIIRYWYDGALIIDHDDVLLRTGEHTDMKFNQFLMAPYIGDGSPVEQTMWIDNLRVTTSRMNPSFSEDASKTQIEIFPNPATEFVEIRCKDFYGFGTGNDFVDESIGIYNLFGEVVKEVVQNSGIKYRLKICVEELPIGVYYLSLKNKKYKFIKN